MLRYNDDLRANADFTLYEVLDGNDRCNKNNKYKNKYDKITGLLKSYGAIRYQDKIYNEFLENIIGKKTDFLDLVTNAMEYQERFNGAKEGIFLEESNLILNDGICFPMVGKKTEKGLVIPYCNAGLITRTSMRELKEKHNNIYFSNQNDNNPIIDLIKFCTSHTGDDQIKGLEANKNISLRAYKTMFPSDDSTMKKKFKIAEGLIDYYNNVVFPVKGGYYGHIKIILSKHLDDVGNAKNTGYEHGCIEYSIVVDLTCTT